MELQYKSKNGQYHAKFEGKDPKEIIEQLYDFYRVFEQHDTCGLCKSKNIYFNVRNTKDGDKYYERKCGEEKCGAALTFHQNKKGGGLYIGWKDEWKKWVFKPNDGEEEGNEIPDKPAAKAKK